VPTLWRSGAHTAQDTFADTACLLQHQLAPGEFQEDMQAAVHSSLCCQNVFEKWVNKGKGE
jgi:hypothetical protein